jgi:hypothetical protein
MVIAEPAPHFFGLGEHVWLSVGDIRRDVLIEDIAHFLANDVRSHRQHPLTRGVFEFDPDNDRQLVWTGRIVKTDVRIERENSTVASAILRPAIQPTLRKTPVQALKLLLNHAMHLVPVRRGRLDIAVQSAGAHR